MYRATALLIMVIALGACSFDPIPYSRETYIVTAPTLDVWSGSYPRTDVVNSDYMFLRLKRGEETRVLEKKSQWFKVKLPQPALSQYFRHEEGWVNSNYLEKITINETVFSQDVVYRKMVVLGTRLTEAVKVGDRYYAGGYKLPLIKEEENTMTFQLPTGDLYRTQKNSDPLFVKEVKWNVKKNKEENFSEPMPSLFFRIIATSIDLSTGAVLLLLAALAALFVIFTYIHRSNRPRGFLTFFLFLLILQSCNYTQFVDSVKEGNRSDFWSGMYDFFNVIYIPSLAGLYGLFIFGAWKALPYVLSFSTGKVHVAERDEFLNEEKIPMNEDPLGGVPIPEVISADSVKETVEKAISVSGGDRSLLKHVVNRLTERIQYQADIKTAERLIEYINKRTAAYTAQIELVKTQQRYKDLSKELELQRTTQDLDIVKTKNQIELEIKRKETELKELELRAKRAESELQGLTQKLTPEEEAKQKERKIKLEARLESLRLKKIRGAVKKKIKTEKEYKKELEKAGYSPADIEEMLREFRQRVYEKE